MFNKNELLESKEFWDEILSNILERILTKESNYDEESEYLWKHIDTLIKNLKPNELRAVNRNEYAGNLFNPEFCIYTNKCETKQCLENEHFKCFSDRRIK